MPTPEELYGQQAPTPEERYGQQPVVPEVARVQEPTLGEAMLEEAPQTVGGIAGGIAGATKGMAAGIPFGPMGVAVGGIAGGALGAGLGGAAGKGYQQVYRGLTGREDIPKTSYEAAVEMTRAGGEEAAWDLGGQLVGRVIGKAYHFIRPKAVDDIEKLAVKLEKAGGQMTAAQRSDSWVLHQLDSLTRGSLTGSGRMQAIDTLNEAALNNIEGELRRNISKNVSAHLSDQELGQLFLDTAKQGRNAHRTVVGEMYGGFDDLVPVKQMGDELVNPVSTKGMKEKLTPFRAQLERIKYAGESTDSKKLLDTIFAQDETLTFSDAQALRSNLLDAQRNLEGSIGKSKISSKVNTVVDEITKAMDEAALLESPATQAKYRAIKKYANKGYKTFDNKFISDLIIAEKKNPERIGEYIFRTGNVQEINQVKKALRTAAVIDKTKGISYDKVWSQMQSGYLDNVLRRSSVPGEVAAGATTVEMATQGLDVSGARLLKEFTDPKKARTLAAAFSREQRESILEFAKVAERTQRKPSGSLGMLMQLTQGGAIIGAATGSLEPGEAGALFVAPLVLSRLMTNPKTARLLATAMKTPNTNGRATAVMSQLAGYVNAIQQEQEK